MVTMLATILASCLRHEGVVPGAVGVVVEVVKLYTLLAAIRRYLGTLMSLIGSGIDVLLT